ncbi:MAG TPA: hypothetical protein VGO57_15230 [Verrucomicrobiae bacterium]|jgi:hypothetical protein
MSQFNNPTWWTSEHDSAWERTKAAFKRDWDQTKHDLGGAEPDTGQGIKDTVKQAAGKEPIPPRGTINFVEFETVEPAYRFGYGARVHYGKDYISWDDDIEQILRREWTTTYPERNWEDDVEYVQEGWDYEQ